MQVIVALELLGPVLTPGRTGLWDARVIPAARRMLQDLSDAGVGILIHTTLISDDHSTPDPTQQAARVEQYLHDQGLPFDWVWNRPGKPLATHFVETQDDLQAVHRAVMSGVREDETTAGVLTGQTKLSGMHGLESSSGQAGVQTPVVNRRNKTR